MKKRGLIAIIVTLLVAAGIAFTLYQNKTKINKANKPKSKVEIEIPVNVTEIKSQRLDKSLVKTGTLEPFKTATISATAGGELVSLRLSQGSYVRKGQAVGVVDNKQVQLGIQTAELERNQAKVDYERYKALYEGDAAPKTAFEGAKLRYDAAVQQVKTLRSQRTNFNVLAPISGIVTMKMKEAGEFVGPGVPIANIVDISSLKVKVLVDEAAAYQIIRGQSAKVTTDAYPGVEFSGKVTFISPVADQTKNFPIEITIANSRSNPLKAGSFAYVDFIKGSAGTYITIPRSALLESTDNPIVYVVKQNKRLEKRTVVLGKEFGDVLEVLDGLKEGEQVVSSGIINVKEGALVKPIKANVNVM